MAFQHPFNDSKELIVHIVAPTFSESGRKLFPNNGLTLCGTNKESRNKSSSYVSTGAKYGMEELLYFDSVPDGYGVCGACLRRLKAEYLPFAEENGE